MPISKIQNEDFDSRLAKVETELSGMKEMIVGVVSNIHSIQASLSAAKQTNWGLILSLVASVGLVIAGLYTTLSSESEKMSLQSQMQMMTYSQPIVMAAEQSRVDRQELHQRLESNGSRLSTLESKQAAAEAALGETLRELEAQMRNIGNVVNLSKDHQEVVDGIMWEKLFGAKIPQTFFRPEMHRQR